MKAVKFLISSLCNNSRDIREINVLTQIFDEVVVFTGDESINDINIDGANIIKKNHYYDCKGIKNSLKRKYIIISNFIATAKELRSLNADLISCHDIIALLIGYISNLCKKHKAKLVYDSHEFELGRNTNRSKFKTWGIKQVERFLIKRSELTIVVNDSIADELVKIYKLKERPVVVRNIPENWVLNENQIKETRQEINKKFQCNDETFIMMFHGGIGRYCGIEDDIKVLKLLPDLRFIILGYGEEDYIESLKNLIKQEGVGDRVLFLPAVPLKELYKYCGAVNVGLCNSIATCKSYYFALPNKLFESIQSLTPVIVSEYPEMIRVVDKYNIGLKVEPDSISSLKDAIIMLMQDSALRDKFKNNLKVAKEELCWEREKRILEDAYKHLSI